MQNHNMGLDFPNPVRYFENMFFLQFRSSLKHEKIVHHKFSLKCSLEPWSQHSLLFCATLLCKMPHFHTTFTTKYYMEKDSCNFNMKHGLNSCSIFSKTLTMQICLVSCNMPHRGENNWIPNARNLYRISYTLQESWKSRTLFCQVVSPPCLMPLSVPYIIISYSLFSYVINISYTM